MVSGTQDRPLDNVETTPDDGSGLDVALLVNCRDCPCLNNDNESGADCNLGFHTDYKKLFGEWYEFSDNCELVEIKTRTKTFHPLPLKFD